jgi:hypothetical protein
VTIASSGSSHHSILPVDPRWTKRFILSYNFQDLRSYDEERGTPHLFRMNARTRNSQPPVRIEVTASQYWQTSTYKENPSLWNLPGTFRFSSARHNYHVVIWKQSLPINATLVDVGNWFLWLCTFLCAQAGNLALMISWITDNVNVVMIPVEFIHCFLSLPLTERENKLTNQISLFRFNGFVTFVDTFWLCVERIFLSEYFLLSFRAYNVLTGIKAYICIFSQKKKSLKS